MAHKTKELVRRYQASGLTQSDFCKKHSVPLSTLHYHISRSRQEKDSANPSNFLTLNRGVSLSDSQTILIVHGRFSTQQIAVLARCVTEQ